MRPFEYRPRDRTQFEPRNAALSSSSSFWPEEGKCKQYGCKTMIRRGSPATNPAELSNDIAAEVFDDVLYTEISEDGDKISFATSKPVRKINWQIHRNALGEHVAGLYCKDTQSYNGNHISVGEMKTCTTVLCLIQKTGRVRNWLSAWVSDPDDEEFERESKHFLSGLDDRIGSWEDDAFCPPMHHNVVELDPALGSRRGFASGDMSFHPYCLEIYRRISECRVGTVDMEGLAEWWNGS